MSCHFHRYLPTYCPQHFERVSRNKSAYQFSHNLNEKSSKKKKKYLQEDLYWGKQPVDKIDVSFLEKTSSSESVTCKEEKKCYKKKKHNDDEVKKSQKIEKEDNPTLVNINVNSDKNTEDLSKLLQDIYKLDNVQINVNWN